MSGLDLSPFRKDERIVNRKLHPRPGSQPPEARWPWRCKAGHNLWRAVPLKVPWLQIGPIPPKALLLRRSCNSRFGRRGAAHLPGLQNYAECIPHQAPHRSRCVASAGSES